MPLRLQKSLMHSLNVGFGLNESALSFFTRAFGNNCTVKPINTIIIWVIFFKISGPTAKYLGAYVTKIVTLQSLGQTDLPGPLIMWSVFRGGVQLSSSPTEKQSPSGLVLQPPTSRPGQTALPGPLIPWSVFRGRVQLRSSPTEKQSSSGLVLQPPASRPNTKQMVRGDSQQ